MPNPTAENETLSDLETKYKAAENAFINKDIDAVANLMSPEFIGFDENGIRKTRDDVLESVRNQFETSNIISWPRKVTNLSTDGDVFINGNRRRRLQGRETPEPCCS